MKLPIISRRRHQKIVDSVKGRTIVYLPVDEQTRKRLKTATSVNEKYAFHDGRIGWVERQEFDSYSEYIKFLQGDESYQKYLARKSKKENA
jgi:hypothetical protein